MGQLCGLLKLRCRHFCGKLVDRHFANTSSFLFCYLWELSDIGAAYGTAKAGQGIMAMGIRSPELLMKNIIPVVMAGVLGIYGLM